MGLSVELSRRGQIEICFKKSKLNFNNMFKQKIIVNIALLIE